LQLVPGPSGAVDDEHRSTTVEEQGAALRRAKARWVRNRQSRCFRKGVGDHHAVGEALQLDPGPTQLDEVLEGVGHKPGRFAHVRHATLMLTEEVLVEEFDDHGVS
jgi:hypothetical protein